MIDPALFDPAAISDEIRAQNAEIVANLSGLRPTPASVSAGAVGSGGARAGPVPAHAREPAGRGHHHRRAGGPLPLRIIAPLTRAASITTSMAAAGRWVRPTSRIRGSTVSRTSAGLRCRLRRVPAGSGESLSGRARRLRGGRSLAPRGGGPFRARPACSSAASRPAPISSVTFCACATSTGLDALRARTSSQDATICHDAERRQLGQRELDPRDARHRALRREFLRLGLDRAIPDVSPLYADLRGCPPSSFQSARGTPRGRHALHVGPLGRGRQPDRPRRLAGRMPRLHPLRKRAHRAGAVADRCLRRDGSNRRSPGRGAGSRRSSRRR